MLDSRLIGLILVFVPLSLLSFGGGQAIVADIQYQTVEVHKWLTNSEFVDMFAISRASPGPSTLIAALDRLARGRTCRRARRGAGDLYPVVDPGLCRGELVAAQRGVAAAHRDRARPPAGRRSA